MCDLPILLRRCCAILALALGVTVSLTPAVRAQDAGDVTEALARVEAGLEEADAGAVLVDAASRIEVVLFGQGGIYRRGQAVQVLRDFFRRYPPGHVAFLEQGSSDDSRTAIGRYHLRDGGLPLEVRVQQRPEDSTWQLVAIRIEQPSLLRGGGR